MRILIVRLGSLGDIIHTLPAAAALRHTFPAARLDWLVDSRHHEILDLVAILDTRVLLQSSASGWWRVIGALRRGRYDVAVDLQGLLKSAILARAAGARRTMGFARRHLRERAARLFYTETCAPPANLHVIEKNLAVARALGAQDAPRPFPIDVPESPVVATVKTWAESARTKRFALLNPGAAWPNKRWPAERFGRLAAALRERVGLPSIVLWGPGEHALAAAVAHASAGAAEAAPSTTIADVAALARSAAVMISGDTGPLHLAAALGTPLVGIYGPTDPRRNGPWSAADVTVSRCDVCQCPHLRRCRARRWCLDSVTVEELVDAVARRLAGDGAGHSGPHIVPRGFGATSDRGGSAASSDPGS